MFIAIFLFAIRGLHAQQDAQWSHFMFNQQFYNPAYSGVEQVTRFSLLHRTQWLGYEATISADRDGGAPSQQELSISHPLKILKSPVVNSGIGLVVVNDKLGPLRKQDVKLDFAYHYKPRFGGTISFGVRAGIQSQSIDGSLLRAAEEGDFIVESFGNDRLSQVRPDFGAGIYYDTRKYYINAALSHLTKSSFDFGTDSDSLNSELARNLTLAAGYNIFLSRLTVTPALHYISDFNHSSFNLGILANIDDYKYWAGASFRQSFVDQEVNDGGKQLITDDFFVVLGISLLKDKALRIGYAFDLVTSGVDAKSGTSHEIMLSYALPVSLEKRKTPIKDPRYRHE